MHSSYTLDDHEDVQLEMHDIVKEKRNHKSVYWHGMAIIFVVNVSALTAVWLVVSVVFTSQLVAMMVICTAYVCAVLGMAIDRMQRRVDRMEMHALTVHNAVLQLREQIEIEKGHHDTTHHFDKIAG